jgi:glycine cleavage system H protein
MNIPEGLKYTVNDEWVKMEEGVGVVGISDYAQNQLSDVVFVEVVVSVGDVVKKGDTCATVESVKAAADVYLPISGTVVEVNEELPANPELVNSDPYGKAWMLKVQPSNPDELNNLLDAKAYSNHIESKEH